MKMVITPGLQLFSYQGHDSCPPVVFLRSVGMTMRAPASLRPGQILSRPFFNEPMRLETVSSSGDCSWVVGLVGVQTERFRRVTLTVEELAQCSL